MRKRANLQLRDRRTSAKTNRDDRFESRQCTNKQRLTETDAARIAGAQQGRTGLKVQAYKCRYRDHWHVGRVRVRLPDGIVTFERAP